MSWKELVVLVIMVTICFLAITLLLRYKDQIDDYGKVKTEWVGNLIYAKTPAWSSHNNTWGGTLPSVQFTDGTIEVGLRSDGVLTWKKAEGKKWQDMKGR